VMKALWGQSLHYVRGQVAPPSGRWHQSPAATPQNSAVVRRSYGSDAAAYRKVGRRLNHAVFGPSAATTTGGSSPAGANLLMPSR
jgi:hypothetical protein